MHWAKSEPFRLAGIPLPDHGSSNTPDDRKEPAQAGDRAHAAARNTFESDAGLRGLANEKETTQ
jgi:hypothetical protein